MTTDEPVAMPAGMPVKPFMMSEADVAAYPAAAWAEIQYHRQERAALMAERDARAAAAAKECAICGGLPAGEASGAADLCTCDSPAERNKAAAPDYTAALMEGARGSLALLTRLSGAANAQPIEGIDDLLMRPAAALIEIEALRDEVVRLTAEYNKAAAELAAVCPYCAKGDEPRQSHVFADLWVHRLPDTGAPRVCRRRPAARGGDPFSGSR